jgi:hypothetical protein
MTLKATDGCTTVGSNNVDQKVFSKEEDQEARENAIMSPFGRSEQEIGNVSVCGS